MQNPIDKSVSLVAGYADLILDDRLRTGDTPRNVAAVASSAGGTVLVIATPSPPGDGVPGLNPCGKDILALLATAEAPRRRPGEQ